MQKDELKKCDHNILEAVGEFWGMRARQFLMARPYKCRKCKKIYDIITMHEITKEMVK